MRPINVSVIKNKGRGIGLVAASLVISAYGIRFAYLALGILTFSTATLYMIVYHIFLKKLELKRFSKSKQGIYCKFHLN